MIKLGNPLSSKSRWTMAFGMFGALLATACGDDDSTPPEKEEVEHDAGKDPTNEPETPSAETPSAETSGPDTSHSGETTTEVPGASSETFDAGGMEGGASDGGEETIAESDAGDTDTGEPGPGKSSWIVGGWLSTEEGYFGYLTVLDDLSADGSIALEKVHAFPGDITYTSTGDGKVFIGQEGLPTIERWVLNQSKTGLEKDAEISLDYFGVTSTLGPEVQILDEETAWYFDTTTYQVIVFNPTTMTTEGETIDFSGVLEGDNDVVLSGVSRLDDALVISAQYWNADGDPVSLTRAAIIDIESGDVTYADEPRCGSTRFHVRDAAGNLYIGAHPGESLWQGAGLGLEDAPKPCLVRIKSGETAFDTDYYVNLEEISGGKVVGGFLQGDGNHAYVYEFAGDVSEVNAENYNPQLRGDNWALARIELGNEAESYELVEDYAPSTSYGDSFTVEVGNEMVRYLVSVNASFESGQYYDMSNPSRAVTALSFPGFPGSAFNY